MHARLGGEGEIRTRGTIADTTVFKTVPLNHSGTSPGVAKTIITDRAASVEWQPIVSEGTGMPTLSLFTTHPMLYLQLSSKTPILSPRC